MTVRLIGWQAAGGIAAQVADVSVADQIDLVIGAQPEPRQEAVLTPEQAAAFTRFGELARDKVSSERLREIYLTLPEGLTVAQAMSELMYRLRADGEERGEESDAR